ncbi:MAG: hypothetical protein MZV65_28425 [Chromatiales bacterium]|nr:hypothetical protein [Chromatiales bacterium]
MLHPNGSDRIIDCGLLKCGRLPDSRMLGYRIRQGTVEDQDIVKVAQRLADFYQHTAPVAMDAAAYRQRFIEDIKASAAEWSTPEFGLSAARIRRITDVQLAFLQDRAALFTERLAERRIIETPWRLAT